MKFEQLLSIVMEKTDVIKLYHVSPSRNRKNVLSIGLIPKIGPRSKKLGEPEKAIYLFGSMDDLEDALMNWLLDEFSENTKLDIFEIRLDASKSLSEYNIVKHEDVWEYVGYAPIPANLITYLRSE